MRLSIKKKAVIFILSSLVVVLGSIMTLNYQSQKSSFESLYESNAEALKFAFSKNVESIMRSGENEQLQPLIEEFQSKKMVDEISIVNSDKIVTRSTDMGSIEKLSNDPRWAEVFRTGNDITLKEQINGEPKLVSYKAYKNEGSCTECHDIDSEKILGGLKIVKSEKEMVETIAASSKNNLILGIIGTLLILFGIVIFLNRNVFKPIRQVQEKLQKASTGDVNQSIIIKSEDEIGSLLQSIKNLMDYLKDLSVIADSIAQNDLSVSVTPKSEQDTLGHSFASMVRNLTEVIRQINSSSTEVASAATQISASSEQVAKNTQNQEEQISQITTAIEEMTATIVESSQNASDATTGAQTASDTAGNGGQIVNETIDGMNRIAKVVQESSSNIHKLAESAEQIGAIIAVIDDIADQTNLLALNAAIEAARAGEQGRGFAVVADEVRKLAERTGKATGEITEMIKGVQSGTDEAVTIMEEGNQEVISGKALADKAGNSLSEVVQSSQNVMNMIMQIATATEEQSAAAEQISKNIEMVSAGTRESATGAEQASSAAVQLSTNAENLQNIVGKFKLN